MILDLGTGDGRAVLRLARREPESLVIGLDPDAAALRRVSQRAARSAARGGQPNALFLSGSAEELPGPLYSRLDRMTVVLPWGALLRGVVRPEAALLEGLRQSLRGGGELELLLSVGERDLPAGLPALDRPAIDRLSVAYARAGLCPSRVGEATAADVERLSSTWAKRLGVPGRRSAWLLRFVRSSSVTLKLDAPVVALVE